MPRRPVPRALRVGWSLLAVGLVVALAGCDSAGKQAPEGPAPAPATTTSPAGPVAEVTAYFVGSTPRGPRLFLEPHQVAADADRLHAAVALLLRGDPLDPDYRSLLPRRSVDLGAPVATHRAGGRTTYTIAVGGRRWTRRPHDLTAAQARLAVQQLAYTLRAAGGGGSREPVRVAFRLHGRTVRLLGVPSGVAAGPPARTLAAVDVLAPAEGTRVSGDTLSAHGLADSLEAHVPWQVLDARGHVVLHGFTTAAGSGRRLYPWRATVDIGSLRPGRYTLLVKTWDPAGRKGPAATEDTTSFRVG